MRRSGIVGLFKKGVAIHDEYPVGHFIGLFRVGGGDEGGSLGMMANGGNDILPRADIDALKRFVQQKQTAGFGLPPADDDLCWLPPESDQMEASADCALIDRRWIAFCPSSFSRLDRRKPDGYHF